MGHETLGVMSWGLGSCPLRRGRLAQCLSALLFLPPHYSFYTLLHVVRIDHHTWAKLALQHTEETKLMEQMLAFCSSRDSDMTDGQTPKATGSS